jgi:general stress protein 26
MSGELGKLMAQKITTEMPREQLEEHISSILKELTMCTLITSKDDIPRGTPLEYFPDGLTLYISPDPGTKVENIRANPNVAISIHNSVHPDWENDWQTIWGVQISGTGELFDEGAPEHTHGRELINFESFFRALELDPEKWLKGRKILKVTPSKIALFQLGLLTKGFSAWQTWQAKG